LVIDANFAILSSRPSGGNNGEENTMNIAFIGTGNVGAPLAARLAEAGHHVVLAKGRAESASLDLALRRSEKLKAQSMADALRGADVIFVATPFPAVEGILRPLGEELAGKIVVDCTNPVGPGLSHGLKSQQSGSEFIQALVPKAHVVKAFTIYGFENLENPSYADYNVLPVMLYCGDDERAKQLVNTCIVDCGFEALDVGGLVQALHLEHMTLLWVRMVRAQGHSPHLVWAALQRPRKTP
jgi:predicted dinucleotide-binding enzyme